MGNNNMFYVHGTTCNISKRRMLHVATCKCLVFNLYDTDGGMLATYYNIILCIISHLLECVGCLILIDDSTIA